MRLLREQLLSEEQRRLQAQLGVNLDELQSRLFAFACRQGRVSLTDAKAVSGRAGPEARGFLNTLAVQGLLKPTEQADTYLLADHLENILDAARSGQSASDRFGGESRDLVSDQVGTTRRDLVTPLLTTLTDDQRKIIALCTVSRKRAHLMRETGFTHRTFFRRKRLEPLIRANLIRLTHPDKPSHPDQAYVVTEAGLGLANAWQAESGSETSR